MTDSRGTEASEDAECLQDPTAEGLTQYLKWVIKPIETK